MQRASVLVSPDTKPSVRNAHLPLGSADQQLATAVLLSLVGFIAQDLIHPSAAIVVTTPQLVAHVDGRRAVQMFRHLRIPVIGAVENMSGIVCSACGSHMALYPPTSQDRSIWSLGVECLAAIPFDVSVAGMVNRPTPILAAYENLPFANLADCVIDKLAGGTADSGR